MFDIELYEELRDQLIELNAILSGGETIGELQQMLEEIETEAAFQDFCAEAYSF